MAATHEIRRLLTGVREGNTDARDRLLTIVYEDLRRIARAHLRGRATATLGTTAMVNEAYIRLLGDSPGDYVDRVHFLSTASRAMRHILVDHARRRHAQKRGGGAIGIELADHHAVDTPRVLDLVALDDALEKLAALNERLARVVELRFFGDLSEEETALVLDVAVRTVRRDWRKARSFLYREMGTSTTP